ncbi:hypothetical protein C8F04DRAFT_1252289 [Mycena alexandri]|uniref:Uncharacterized protein n=1 Tax=Mycena alexandri TaxID=1745969 RepID=A0AAD6TB16_9AGAR|nr:hypothetical protein C8F04DRAFT_1252289 [Mycena alexandri]
MEVLASLARSHSNLTILHLEPGFSSNRTLDGRCALICALTHVQEVEVGTVDLAALMHLGQLQSLDTLDIILSASISFPLAATRRLFHNLESIKLRETPKVYFFDGSLDFCPKPNEVEEVYRSLGEHCCHASLETFSLGHYNIPDPRSQHAPAFVHPGDGLRPLFCFSGLQAITIHSSAGFDLDDASIADMARAWPDLTDLHLGCEMQACQPRGTLLAIRALAEHCDRPASMPGGIWLNSSLVSWNTGYSPATPGSAFPVARFLSATCLNLKEVMPAGYWGDLDNFDPDEPARRKKLWTEVAGCLLPALGEIQQEEWTNGQTVVGYAVQTVINNLQ